MEPLPALVSSLWTNKRSTQTHTHTRACGFTHMFSNLFVEKAEKNEREWQRNGTRTMCVLTETLTVFLKVMKHFLSMRRRFSIWNLSSLFVLSIHLGFGRVEDMRRKWRSMDFLKDTWPTVVWLAEQRAALLSLVEQRTWRCDFGFKSKQEKCNYFKCSQQFCWSGSLPISL